MFWVERVRRSAEQGFDTTSLMKLFKSALHANLLFLETLQEGAAVRYTDFSIAEELSESLCLPSGLYGKLAKIRFTHLFDSRSQALQKLAAAGHPQIAALAAVPVIRRDRPVGCLAASASQPMKFTSDYIMLLAVAAELTSLASVFSCAAETEP